MSLLHEELARERWRSHLEEAELRREARQVRAVRRAERRVRKASARLVRVRARVRAVCE